MITILFSALLPLLSQAGAFEDGQKAFANIKEIRDLAIEPIEFVYSAELARLRERIAEQERLKGECTTFVMCSDWICVKSPRE